MSSSDIDVYLTNDDYQKIAAFEGLYGQEKEKVETLMRENENLKKDLKTLDTTIESISNQRDKAVIEKKALQNLLIKAEERAKQQQELKQKKEKECQELTEENKLNEGDLVEKEWKIQQLKEEVQTLKRQMKQKENAIKEMKLIMEKEQKNGKQHEKDVEKLNIMLCAEKKSKQKVVLQISKVCDQTHKAYIEVTQRVNELTKQFEQATKSANQSQAEVDELRSELANKSQQFNNIHEQYSKLRTQYQRLSNTKEELQARNSVLVSLLNNKQHYVRQYLKKVQIELQKNEDLPHTEQLLQNQIDSLITYLQKYKL